MFLLFEYPPALLPGHGKVLSAIQKKMEQLRHFLAESSVHGGTENNGCLQCTYHNVTLFLFYEENIVQD
jgi:hypothetical protein